jgi:hypothetical protein
MLEIAAPYLGLIARSGSCADAPPGLGSRGDGHAGEDPVSSL